MEFPEFPYPPDTLSYPTYNDVHAYLMKYANHFNLTDHIQLNHLVTNVVSLPKNKWNVTVRHTPSRNEETITFDAVFVCTNIFSNPSFPPLDGARRLMSDANKVFMHSRNYRSPYDYAGLLFNSQ